MRSFAARVIAEHKRQNTGGETFFPGHPYPQAKSFLFDRQRARSPLRGLSDFADLNFIVCAIYKTPESNGRFVSSCGAYDVSRYEAGRPPGVTKMVRMDEDVPANETLIQSTYYATAN